VLARDDAAVTRAFQTNSDGYYGADLHCLVIGRCASWLWVETREVGTSMTSKSDAEKAIEEWDASETPSPVFLRGEALSLSKEYGVTNQAMYALLKGETWKSV
jgi:hypothetical protein